MGSKSEKQPQDDQRPAPSSVSSAGSGAPPQAAEEETEDLGCFAIKPQKPIGFSLY